MIDLSGDGGAVKEILQNGIGEAKPHSGCRVSLHYTGKLVDGTVFDSSLDRARPFEFDVGKDQVIKAFDLCVISMKKGEKCRLTCAPSYAYGVHGSPPKILPNSTLIFDLEMLGWQDEDISPNLDNSIERFILKASDRKRQPSDGVSIKVHLIGQYEGRVFDDRVVQFDYGEGGAINIIEGVEIGIRHMSVGETSKFTVQAKYAFGAEGNAEFNIPSKATVEYTVTLLECEKGIEDWKLSTVERLAQAKVFKEKGTSYYKNNNYDLAIKMYKKCIEFVASENTEECQGLKVTSHSNIALCYQKTNHQFEGKQACDEALKLDPKNIKALYRRGQCNLAINEFQSALQDLQEILNIEPNNKAAYNQIQICKQKIKESNDKEKKIYANMFTKFAAADNQPVIEMETDVLSKCGEWTEEDEATDHEMDLAFEHDNNIILI